MFQAEDTADRVLCQFPGALHHLPTIKLELTPALQPASQPKGTLENPSANPHKHCPSCTGLRAQESLL